MKKIKQFTLVLLASVLFSACHRGYMSSNAKDLEKYINPSELKKIVDNPDPNIWIIDLRPASMYNKGHIPTAKSFPDIINHLDEIPKDKQLILYCIFSPGAQMNIKKLEKAGYTKNLNWGRYSRWPYETEKTKK